MNRFYQKSAAAVLKELSVSRSRGLTKKEAAQRLSEHGPNQLESKKGVSALGLFLGQFKDILIIVLIAAATISLGLSFIDDSTGGPTQSLLIYGIVFAIAIIGFLNEYKAEKTVEALKKLIGQNATVRRDGENIEIEASKIVPGDILILQEGMKVVADARLINVRSLSVNESSLTGESVPATKNELTINSEAPLGDQKNMVFSGTIVTTGTAEAAVVATGSHTQIGHIADLVSEVEDEQTPMQKKLDDLGRKIGAVVLGISILVFVVVYFFDKELVDESSLQRLILAFTAAVALAVAAIPEGLAFVVRISLALGARRMAAKDALVRKLSAVEALGSTDVICTDKTGTLTRGEMTVRSIYTGDTHYSVEGAGYDLEGEFFEGDVKLDNPKQLVPLLRIGALCNNAFIKEGAVLGDPTEAAMIVSAAKAGIDHKAISSSYKRVDELPFSSDRKMMSTVHKTSRGYLVAAKGATDRLLEKCDRIVIGGRIHKLTPALKKKVMKHDTDMAKQALRVLGFAYREDTKLPTGEKAIESKLIFMGLQGMMDPPREDVKDVMHRITAEAGMRVLMITGDHVETARAVAAEIGIEGDAITGPELDQMTQREFEKKVEKISVYARVNPEHKIRIVQALKRHGHQVAMTGDGVNDAPAIKAADIGIAMGVTGTDAAKEAADLILLDDQFLTIIDAIEEGRGIFDNMRKFVGYLLGANVAEVFVILGGVFFLNRLLLSATQLLFINIVTDGLPAVALGSDPSEKGIMRYKPHRFQGAIINGRSWLEMGLYGMVLGIIMVAHYWWILEDSGDVIKAGSVVFAGIVVYELVRLVTVRTDYDIPWFSNPWLSVSIVSSFLLLLSTMYIPFASNLFSIVPISMVDWLVIAVISVCLFALSKTIDIFLDYKFPETAR